MTICRLHICIYRIEMLKNFKFLFQFLCGHFNGFFKVILVADWDVIRNSYPNVCSLKKLLVNSLYFFYFKICDFIETKIAKLYFAFKKLIVISLYFFYFKICSFIEKKKKIAKLFSLSLISELVLEFISMLVIVPVRQARTRNLFNLLRRQIVR